MKVILNDEEATVLEVDSITLEPHFVLQASDMDAFFDIWKKLNHIALEKVQVFHDDVLAAIFSDCELCSTQAIYNSDGSLTCHFYLTGNPVPTIDPDYKTGYQILMGDFDA